MKSKSLNSDLKIFHGKWFRWNMSKTTNNHIDVFDSDDKVIGHIFIGKLVGYYIDNSIDKNGVITD